MEETGVTVRIQLPESLVSLPLSHEDTQLPHGKFVEMMTEKLAVSIVENMPNTSKDADTTMAVESVRDALRQDKNFQNMLASTISTMQPMIDKRAGDDPEYESQEAWKARYSQAFKEVLPEITFDMRRGFELNTVKIIIAAKQSLEFSAKDLLHQFEHPDAKTNGGGAVDGGQRKHGKEK